MGSGMHQLSGDYHGLLRKKFLPLSNIVKLSDQCPRVERIHKNKQLILHKLHTLSYFKILIFLKIFFKYLKQLTI